MARGRKPIYLTIEKFEAFLNNDFYHLRVWVKVLIALTLAIFVKLFIG